ncbi:RNA (guanine-9-)-methyltransferase domain-containing protein 3, partial [Chelonia mydas]
QHSKRVLKEIAKERLLAAKEAAPWLCVKMFVISWKEISRLAAQIRRLYGSNKKAGKPFWICLTGFVAGSPISEECFRMNDGFSNYLKLTLQKAQEHSLQTARLPIAEYMVRNTNAKNYHSETLAINQVFDALSTYYETQSWPEALKAGVPPGKGYVLQDTAI